MVPRFFRASWRLGGFLLTASLALASYFWLMSKPGARVDYAVRGQWAQRWAIRFLRVLRIKTTYSGNCPRQGVLVANHLSYLDILVLAAAQPMVFVAKIEVRSWPLIGWLAGCAGTLFINREHRADVAQLAPAFRPVIEQGSVLVFFPEGTSTGGDRVLPFMSSLFEPAAANQWPISPAWLGYGLADGSVSDEICYWRDMTFLPHFLNVLSKKEIRAEVIFGEPLAPGLNRKEMAKRLHATISAWNRSKNPSPHGPADDVATRIVFPAPSISFSLSGVPSGRSRP